MNVEGVAACGDSSAMEVCNAMRTNTCLKSLSLRACSIGPAAADSLLQMVGGKLGVKLSL